jgi:predicted NAD/FAD-binding protein
MKKLAVIGTGIAGMSAAYFLKDEYEITVFEKNDYVGGHTNTIFVNDGEKECPMDTGFMVFNEHTYPNLLKLFAKLGVEYTDTDMGFAVYHEESGLEYNGSSMGGLFTQRKNIFNFKFIKMLLEIMKFNKKSMELLESAGNEDLTIREYVKSLGLGDDFLLKFLVPMSSAVWSTPEDKMMDFPAKSLVQFFYNHGFLGVNTQFQWKTVVGGSRQYREKLIDSYKDKIKVESGVREVEKLGDKVLVKTETAEFGFDKVIIAAHGDEAYQMLKNPTPFQTEVISKFTYQENVATVHTDESVMPTLKRNWRSWNYITRKEGVNYTTYWMNSLQGVSKKQNFFVNINGEEYVDKDKVFKTIIYHHPVFTNEAVKAQAKIDELNKEGPIYFTGSYYRYGFHEDALLSTVELMKKSFNKDVWE